MDRLFGNIPGRKHKTYTDFAPSVHVANQARFKRLLITYSKRFDDIQKNAVNAWYVYMVTHHYFFNHVFDYVYL